MIVIFHNRAPLIRAHGFGPRALIHLAAVLEDQGRTTQRLGSVAGFNVRRAQLRHAPEHGPWGVVR